MPHSAIDRADGSRDDGIQRDELVAAISERRADVRTYLKRTRSTISRWSTTSLIASAIAAALTGGPAFGGKEFAESAQDVLALPDVVNVWQPLCLGALLASVLAAIATQMCRSREGTGRVGIAEGASGELDSLLIDLKCGDLPPDAALHRYREVAEKIGFV